MNIPEKIKAAGVVGAGGGGFPAAVKAQSKVEFVIANGAECEPLIHKDNELMVHFAHEIIEGMKLVMQSTGAKKGYFGIKAKNKNAVEAISKEIKNSNIEMVLLGDYYPAGDEYELVYESTKRLIPAGEIPLNIGCLVNNVETLYNIASAVQDVPVTEKMICITGAVKTPKTLLVPIGTSLAEVIAAAGGATSKEFGSFAGGTMMGTLTFNLNDVVTKTSAGYIVLPVSHHLISRKNQPEQNWHRIGKSACDQCTFCTELCPRYLLGYDVQPHKVMRSLGFTTTGTAFWNQFADLCCACGLCTLYSCPEDLYPKEACDTAKKNMRTEGFHYKQVAEVKVHPMKEGRRVPIQQLMKRLRLNEYDRHTPFSNEKLLVNSVNIFLKQHIGEPSDPIVKEGEYVKKNQLIAEIPEGKLGSSIHASIDGIITSVSQQSITISRRTK